MVIIGGLFGIIITSVIGMQIAASYSSAQAAVFLTGASIVLNAIIVAIILLGIASWIHSRSPQL
jgi:hypothetical protein